MPSPPDADPVMPQITALPTAAPINGEPGMLTMAFTMTGNAGIALTTEPNPTTAQVLKIIIVADFTPSPK